MTKNASTISLSLANPPSTTDKWSNISTGVRHFQPFEFECTVSKNDHTTNFDNRSFGYPPIGVHSTPTTHAEVQPNTLSTAMGKEGTFEGLAFDSTKTPGFNEGDTNVDVDDMSGQIYRRRNAQPAIQPIPLSPVEAGLMSENERSMERSNSNNPFLPENMRRDIQHQYLQPGTYGHGDWYYISPLGGYEDGSDKSAQLGEIDQVDNVNANANTINHDQARGSKTTHGDDEAITDEHPSRIHVRQQDYQPSYIPKLESTIHTLQTELSSLKEDYSAMADRKEHYKGKYNQTYTDLTNANERTDSLNRSIREFKEMYTKACEISQRNYTDWSKSQSVILDLNGKIKSLLNDQETMQSRIEELEGDKVRLYAANHALRSEMQGLDEQIRTYRNGSYQDGLRIAEEKMYSESLRTKVKDLEDYIHKSNPQQGEGYERSIFGKGGDEKVYRYEEREPTQAQDDQADRADRSE